MLKIYAMGLEFFRKKLEVCILLMVCYLVMLLTIEHFHKAKETKKI